MTRPYRWTGSIPKDWDGSPVVLMDNFGFTITLTGELTDVGCFRIAGVNGNVPEAFRVPWMDDPEPIPQ